jgi:[calcium/calmodulin-dependent protein kinase] kinase
MRALPAGIGFNSPLHRHSTTEENNAFELIKEEIAIMKKLNHPNLVTLIEVLDDPEEDSLYMVMEMCKKGVVMQVGLEERADPYSEEQCRCWFRDMILGLEYRMSQPISATGYTDFRQSTLRVLSTETSNPTTAWLPKRMC